MQPWMRTFCWALGLSLLLHLAVLAVPGLHLPGLDELLNPSSANTATIDAQLAAKRVAAAKKNTEAKPDAPVSPQGAADAATPEPVGTEKPADAPDVANSDATSANKSGGEGVAAGAAANVQNGTGTGVGGGAGGNAGGNASPAAARLPESGKVVFEVHKGDDGFVVARAVHEWRVENKRYTLSSVTETVGLAALIRSAKATQTSRGEVTAQGLRPIEFRGERGNSKDSADFDWPAMQLRLGTGATVSLSEGAQDVLSMFYQFSLLPLNQPRVDVMVATGRKLERYTFEIVGSATVQVGNRALVTTHVRTKAIDGDSTEMWLARDLERLPVKIRYTDRKGDSYVLVADEINYQGMK